MMKGPQAASDGSGRELVFSMGDGWATAVVRELLAGEGLPTEDVSEHLETFILARDAGTLAGVVGVELLGEVGLLRSLCVPAGYRGRGLGGVLCERIHAFARSRGVREIFLLTTTARDFFAKRGFEVVARDAVPEAIRRTREFASLCPSTATCMRRSLVEESI